MSHVAGRVRSGIRRISFIPAVQESLVGACFAIALPLDRGLRRMRIAELQVRGKDERPMESIAEQLINAVMDVEAKEMCSACGNSRNA